MICTKCGKLFRSQHAFRFCPECGAATDSDPRIAVLLHIPVWVKHSRPVRFGALGFAGIVAICTVASAMRPGSSSPEKAIEQYYDLLLKGSYGALKDSVPTELRKEMMSDYKLKSSYVKDQWKAVYEDYIEGEKVAEVEIRLLDANRRDSYGGLQDAYITKLCDSMTQYDTRKGGFDTVNITDALYVEYRITAMDEDGKYLRKIDESAYVFEYKGRWYLADAVELFDEICKDC